MYDKYNKVTTITAGTKSPIHKGILFSNSNSTASGVTLHFVSAPGVTFSALIQVAPSGSSLLPIEVHTVPSALPSGVTGFYVN